MATVWVPSLLRHMCGGASRLEAEGATLGDILRSLDARCPGFYDRVVDGGQVRPELAIAIDGEASGFQLHDPVSPASEVSILPAIGGGL